jgi:hypothetical protein
MVQVADHCQVGCMGLKQPLDVKAQYLDFQSKLGLRWLPEAASGIGRILLGFQVFTDPKHKQLLMLRL